MSIVIEAVMNDRSKRVLCTTGAPTGKHTVTNDTATPKSAATSRRHTTFKLPDDMEHSRRSNAPADPTPTARRRRTTMFASLTSRTAASQAALNNEPPCVRHFPQALRGPHLLLLSLTDSALATSRSRHLHLARNFAVAMEARDEDVGATLKATRRAAHHPSFVEELALWVSLLRRKCRSFAHLCVHLYEALLGPPLASDAADHASSLRGVEKLRAAMRHGGPKGPDLSSAGQQGAEFVWLEYCVPVLRHIASAEAVEWGADAATDAARESLTGEVASSASSQGRGPGCNLPASILGKWLVSWVAAWLRSTTSPLRPSEVVDTLCEVREEIEARIRRREEDAAIASQPGMRDATNAMRRRQTILGANRLAEQGIRRRTSVGFAVATAASHRQHTAAQGARDTDADWSPLFVRPEVMEAIAKYVASRGITADGIRRCGPVLRHLLQHCGFLLSRHGEGLLRSRITPGQGASIVQLQRLLDETAGDDYRRCSRIIDTLLLERAAELERADRARRQAAVDDDGPAAEAQDQPTSLGRLTADIVAKACGFPLRPEHLQRAERALLMLEELRDDTIIEVFEAAINTGMRAADPDAAKKRMAVLKAESVKAVELHSKVQMRPDDPVIYVEPDSVPTRQPAFATPVASAPSAPARPQTATLNRPPRIAKYARKAAEERQHQRVQATVEYAAGQRLVRNAVEALEEAVEAPDRAPAKAGDEDPQKSWRQRVRAGAAGRGRSEADRMCPQPPKGAGPASSRPAAGAALVDTHRFHADVLATIKPLIEDDSRRQDVTVRPGAVRDLVAQPPSSVTPRGLARPRSAVQVMADDAARRAQRISGRNELIERQILDLEERGGGSRHVTLGIDVPAMVGAALDGWLDDARRRQAAAEDAARSVVAAASERERRRQAKTAATKKPRCDSPGEAPCQRDGEPFDGDGMVGAVRGRNPLPEALTHMGELDVVALINKVVC